MNAHYRTIGIAILTAMLIGCGSATEVGNPTGVVPTLRTIKGIIPIEFADTTVVAESIDGSTIETPVETDGSFELVLDVSQEYALFVQADDDRIGAFSFEQDELGTRENRLRLGSGGDPLDLGEISFIDGTFQPEFEPRHRLGGVIPLSSEYDLENGSHQGPPSYSP